MLKPFTLLLLTGLLIAANSLSYANAEGGVAEPVEDFEAVYKASFRGIGITATRSLETLSDGTKKFQFFADSWIASLKETSYFNWNDGGRIVPSRYTYERGGLGRDREDEVRFNWENNHVINDVKDKPWKMDIPDGTLDKLGYQLQIQADMIAGKELVEYDIADGGSLKQYGFEVIGEEILDTPAGKFHTVKVKRIREEDAERETIMWLAKNYDYLVVRLQQEEGSKSYEIDLHEAKVNGKQIEGLDE